MLVITSIWWHHDGNSFKMLEISNRPATSQRRHQNKLSPIFVTNIDVARVIRATYPIRWPLRREIELEYEFFTYGSADDRPRKIKNIIFLSIIFIKFCLNYQIQILGLGFSWSYKGLPSWNAWIFYSHFSINTREWVQNKQLKSVFTVLIYR